MLSFLATAPHECAAQWHKGFFRGASAAPEPPPRKPCHHLDLCGYLCGSQNTPAPLARLRIAAAGQSPAAWANQRCLAVATTGRRRMPIYDIRYAIYGMRILG